MHLSAFIYLHMEGEEKATSKKNEPYCEKQMIKITGWESSFGEIYGTFFSVKFHTSASLGILSHLITIITHRIDCRCGSHTRSHLLCFQFPQVKYKINANKYKSISQNGKYFNTMLHLEDNRFIERQFQECAFFLGSLYRRTTSQHSK